MNIAVGRSCYDKVGLILKGSEDNAVKGIEHLPISATQLSIDTSRENPSEYPHEPSSSYGPYRVPGKHFCLHSFSHSCHRKRGRKCKSNIRSKAGFMPSNGISSARFSITGKPIRHFMTTHNRLILVLVSAIGTEDMATEITKNRMFWPPHCRLRPPRHKTPTNIRMNHRAYCVKEESLHFCN